MGNSNENEIKSNVYIFATSVETSFVTCEMAFNFVRRWKELGKPLFLIPKDFRERILTTSTDQEVKLSYLKWLT